MVKKERGKRAKKSLFDLKQYFSLAAKDSSA
jgi:hypothetical protein